jgi:hypothetical protein
MELWRRCRIVQSPWSGGRKAENPVCSFQARRISARSGMLVQTNKPGSLVPAPPRIEPRALDGAAALSVATSNAGRLWGAATPASAAPRIVNVANLIYEDVTTIVFVNPFGNAPRSALHKAFRGGQKRSNLINQSHPRPEMSSYHRPAACRFPAHGIRPQAMQPSEGEACPGRNGRQPSESTYQHSQPA